MAVATISDLETRWHTLTEIETHQATALLEDAEQIIKDLVPRFEELEEATLRAIECSMVKRAMLTDNGGISQMSETTGPFSNSVSYTNPSGDLYLTKSEKQRLRGGVQAAFHIELGGV